MLRQLFERRVVRFSAVGLFNTAADFLILNLLVFGLSFSKVAANSISIALTVSLSYFLNHYIVFRYKEAPSWRKYVEFALLTSVSLILLQNVIIWFFSEVFVAPADGLWAALDTVWQGRFTTEFIRLNSAKVLATLCSLVFNFLVYQKVVFRVRARTR